MGLFRQREEMRRRLNEVIEIFRQKGAVSPDKAMTAEELGLPPRFEEAMKRRLVAPAFLSRWTASTICQRNDSSK